MITLFDILVRSVADPGFETTQGKKYIQPITLGIHNQLFFNLMFFRNQLFCFLNSGIGMFKMSIVSRITSEKYPHLHGLNVKKFVTIKLNETNFLHWKTQFLSLTESNALEDFIFETIFPPTKMIPFCDGRTILTHSLFMENMD